MSNKLHSFYNIRTLEELSEQETSIHNINATVKVLITLVFLIITISFDKYELSAIVPLIFYPIIIMSLGDIPLLDLTKRTIIAMPLILGVGIFNPVFDTAPMISLSWINISGGWISFISIVIRGILTILGAQLLIATTGMTQIALALRSLKVPKIFVMQLLFTYRYIFIFVEEIGRTTRAYSLRSYKSNGVKFSEWGSLVGGLLIRTIDRAERIYQAMNARGFTGEYYIGKENKLKTQDVIYFLGWSAYFLFIRYYNVAEIIGAFINK
jgi:cobalt/nickel transport system permease protein